jgi:polyphenol oxidase
MYDWIKPNWPSPPNVSAIFTTRMGGVSRNNNGAYAGLNLGDHVHDDLFLVQQNRALLREYLPSEPCWLKQVHGAKPLWVDVNTGNLEGDAALSRSSGKVCAILVADCLPIFLCDLAGSVVGVAHAGWRGLAGGVIENSILEMACRRSEIIAWLGPAIGSQHFEIGEEVREVFLKHDNRSSVAFVAGHDGKKWFADLFSLARQRLMSVGVTKVYGGYECTYSNPERFYSYRRDGKTGRMAALIWLTDMKAKRKKNR